MTLAELMAFAGRHPYLSLGLAGITVAAGVLPANQSESLGADLLRADIEKYGEVGELHVDRGFLASQWVADFDAAGGGFGDAREDLEQRGFAGSVASDDANDLAGLDFEGDVLESPKGIDRV